VTADPALDEEFARWRNAGQEPRFWLRDDDAGEPGPALDRLIALCEKFEVPLLLAVVPERAGPALGERLRDVRLVRPCVHGIAHRDNAREGERKIELGGGKKRTGDNRAEQALIDQEDQSSNQTEKNKKRENEDA